MLGLQAASLEQQRELWNTQVRLQHTEILFRELDFYNSAFGSLSTAAALLAGFAFSGLALALAESTQPRLRAALALLCVITTSINLVALCAATFAAIFSVRLALRGADGESNVDQAVRHAREEYKLVLRIFVCGIVFFFLSLGVAGFLQLGAVSAWSGLLVSSLGLGVVFYLFSRIDSRFNLKRTAGLTASRLREAAVRPHVWFGSPRDENLGDGASSAYETSHRLEGYAESVHSARALSQASEDRSYAAAGGLPLRRELSHGSDVDSLRSQLLESGWEQRARSLAESRQASCGAHGDRSSAKAQWGRSAHGAGAGQMAPPEAHHERESSRVAPEHAQSPEVDLEPSANDRARGRGAATCFVQ